MKFTVIAALCSATLISACSSTDNLCEDITLASEQVQACQALQKQITKAKNKPLIRTELERRYQKDCIDVRYYRDDHKTEVCGKKEDIKKAFLQEQK